jgi:hypothetical protein
MGLSMNKKIIVIDLVLVLGSLIVIAGLVGYSRPLAIAPIDEYVTSGSVLFEFEKADKILIDDNLDFSSPQEIYVENGIVVNLKPGKYYWKISGVLESDVRSLTIESEVDLRLRESAGGFEVVNSGNTKLNVDVYSGGILTGKVSLEPEKTEKSWGDKFIGGQADE